MCEQTGVTYLGGDIVWVKLGNCWWPGEVQDQEKLSEEIRSDFKKPPIAVVKFFQEDSYEYVRNINHIYKYSCRRKNEFVRKGLDMHRANKAYMDTFPADVCHAETLTGGDPDIITRDDFIPEKRPSYSNIFRTPTPKKNKTGTGRGRHSLGATPRSAGSGSSKSSRITHPRFTGNNDYGVTIMIQTTPPPKTSQYSCHVCSYETTNLYVMMRHNQSHIDGTYVAPSPKKKKTSPKKNKSAKYFATTNSIDEDLALIRQGVIITTDGSSDSEEDLPPKAKVKSPPKSTTKRKNNKDSNSASKKAKLSKVFNNILADWGDENSNEEAESTENTDLNDKIDNTVNVEPAASEKVNEETISETPDEKLDTEDKNQTGDKHQSGDKPQAPDTPEIENTPQNIAVEDEKKTEEKIPEKVSCFDFDEEETDDTILEKSPGRKIPRVIPPKRISKDTFEDELDKLADESVKSRTEDEPTNYTQLNENEETEPDMEAYKTILEETAMPELPPILEVLGKNIPSKKFAESKTDDSTVDKSNGVLKKSETKASEVSITQAPKKRMVRNFEEFENLMHDQPEGSVKSPPQPKSNLEVSKLKFQVMKKLNDSPTKKQSTSKKEESENEETTPEETNKFFRRRTRHSRSDSEKSESNRRKRKTYLASPKKPESEDVDKIETEFENVALEEKKSVAEETTPAEIQTFLDEPTKEIKASVVEEDKTEIAENLVEEKTDPSLVENVESKNDVAELDSTIESEVPTKTEEEDMQIITQSQDSKNLSDQDVEENFPEDAFLEENFPIAKIEEPPEKDLPSENVSEASRSHKLLADISDICIDNSDNLSGLSTLAAVSELSGNLKSLTEDAEIQSNEVLSNPPNVMEEIARGGTPVLDEPVEEIVPVKPKTLANFSLDFSDSNSESTTIIKKFDNDEHIDTNLSKEDLEPFERTEKKDHRVIEEFEAIESEIEKITLRETPADKLNSFPEDISNNSQDDMEIETSYPEFSIPEPSPEKNSANFQAKNSEIIMNTEMSLESEIAKLTDTQPGTESILPEQQQNTSSSKLLEILTDAPTKKETVARSILSPSSASQQKIQMVVKESKPSHLPKKFDAKSKFIIKSSTYKPAKSAKPIILSEKIIRPMAESENVSVKKVTSKRSLQDVEDIDTFIIQKPNKKPASESIEQHEIILAPKIEPIKNLKAIGVRSRAKPKIIEQTIIKAADVQPVSLQPSDNQQNVLDDSMFDINSMPIVLSDQILTPESIENMPVVMSSMIPSVSTSSPITHTEKNTSTILSKKTGTMKLLNKDKTITSQSTSSQSDSPKTQTIVKNIIPRTLGKNQKIFQATSKMLKQNTAVITQPGKPGKFLVIPTSNSSPSSGSKYTVGKRPVKNLQQISPTTSKLKPIQQNLTSEPTGNKIMIITNERGVQSRVLLTPAQQKLLGCKMPTKITKSPQVKSIAQKSILTSKGTIISPITSKTTALASQTIVTSKGQMYTTQQGGLVTSEGQILTQIKGKPDMKGKKIQLQTSKVMLPDHNKAGDSLQKVTKANILQKTKTILIKGSQGQAIKKIQTSMPESKNVIISPSTQKQQQHLMSMASQHVQGTGKQVVVTSKGQLIKADSKFITKATADKLRMQKSSPIPTRIVSKSNKSQYSYSPAPKQLPSPVVPPLAPITASQKKEISKQIKHSPKVATSVVETPTTSSTKQPNQLVIQDPQGNQTTVTEGQILALPSGETVDGQPQSYVLVTVDESGNLVPISNDTLMSLDPNLAMGGDMSNIVIQIDPGNQEGKTTETAVAHTSNEVQPLEQAHTTIETMNQAQTQEQQLMSVDDQLMITSQAILPATTASEIIATEKSLVETHPEQFVTEETHMVTTDDVNLLHETQQTAVTCNINNGDSSQQLIITGDPESTQKFLDSLTGGNTDLSSLLSGTDGNIIINADGQQILLNTDPDNQILLSVNPDNLGLIPGTSEGESTQFVTQSVKNQDILAAALADTDVFQQEMIEKTISNQSITKVSSSSASQLSPNSSLYPMNVGNVLETSLTLGSPIMTPLEVPSMNNKKILDVETTIQVPSSLELPITITDPNISQTVSQQVLLGNDLQTNLELPITMSESEVTSIRSSGINSPSFVYSLPSLDERSDLEQKRFTETSTVMSADVYNTSLTGSMSMPLLTEEPEINSVEPESTSLDTEISLETDIELIKPEVSVEAEINSVAPDDSSVVPEIISEPPAASSLSEIAAQDSVEQSKLVSESEIVSMGTEITTLEPEHTTIEPAISITAPEISTIEPEISTMEPEITTIEPHISSIESANSTIEPEISTIESETSTIEPKISTIEPEMSTIEPEMSTIEPEISSIESEISTIQPETPTMESEISTIEPENSTLEPEITTIESEISTIRPEFSTIESEITSVDSEMHTAESEIPLTHHVESEHGTVETKIPSTELPVVDSEIESVEPDISSIEPEIPIMSTEIPSVETEVPLVQSEAAMEDPERTSTKSREVISVADTEEIKDNVAIPCSENKQIQNLNFASDSLTTPEKLDAELQIGPIEDDLELNHSVICSSLSEPPPGMFDKSFSSLLNQDDDEDDDSPAEESNLPILQDNVEDAHTILSVPEESTSVESAVNEISTEDQRHSDLLSPSENINFEVDDMMQTDDVHPALSATPISDLNSPRLDIDENSSEIPIQPQIVASLSGSGFDDNISGDEGSNSHEGRRKRSNEEFEESDVKRTKVSCD